MILLVKHLNNTFRSDDHTDVLPSASSTRVVDFEHTVLSHNFSLHMQRLDFVKLLIFYLKELLNSRGDGSFEFISETIAFELKILFGHKII